MEQFENFAPGVVAVQHIFDGEPAINVVLVRLQILLSLLRHRDLEHNQHSKRVRVLFFGPAETFDGRAYPLQYSGRVYAAFDFYGG